MSRPVTSTYTNPAGNPSSFLIIEGPVLSVISASCVIGTCAPSGVEMSTRLRFGMSLRKSREYRTFTGYRRSEEHTSELQSPYDLVCRLLLEKKKKNTQQQINDQND